MKNVRLFYKKGDRMRFISHLDMTRFLARIIRRAGLPVWYTEGFNPHLYMTFALPLSLGMSSEYDVVDIRILDDNYDISTICDRLNLVCPPYIKFFDAKDPIKKAGDVSFAEFKILFDDGGKIKPDLETFLISKNITVSKKTKKGEIKQLDVSDKIVNFCFEICENNTILKITLPAGSVENINPELILTAFFEQNGSYYCYEITRTAIFDGDKKLFK